MREEIIEAVGRINDELYDAYSNNIDDKPILSITFADIYTLIDISFQSESLMLPTINIYHCENDDRIYDEETGEYESFYDYIKRKFKNIQEEICNIKL